MHSRYAKTGVARPVIFWHNAPMIDFIRDMKQALRIKYPVRVNLYVGTDTPDGFDGSHRFKRRKHHIEAAAYPSRPLLDIVAHELCHAATDERHGFRVAYHGEEFQAIVKEALDAAARLGYKVTSDIYIKEIDT